MDKIDRLLEQSLKQRKMRIIFGGYITKKSKAIAITPTISEKYLLKMV